MNMNVGFWLLVCFAISVKLVEARFRCHNRCSGHGYCSDYDNVCYCKTGYQGVDCSERTCPMETAWADKAFDVDKGHQWVECSNAGRCNRRTGVCECSPGYTGIACEKLKCGGSGDDGCNGHGDCITLGQTYAMVASYVNEPSFYLPTFKDPDQLPAWEATHVTMCSCHPGFAGASCEYRLCPKGDDPMTPHTGYRTIVIKFNAFHALAELTGRFLFAFNGESLWFPVGTTLFTAAQCEAAFEALRNIDDVTCTRSTAGDNSVTYTVQLRKFPVMPVETSIYPNDGNPPLSAFVCNLDQVVMYSEENQVFCTIEELNTNKVYPEYAPCSNRGICDFTSGVCFCFQQFSGANCASYKKAIVPLVEREVSINEVFTVESTNPDFEATLLQFQTFDVASSDFKTINVNNLDRNLFSLDGAGNVDMNYGSLIIGDAANVKSSGMTVNTGGLTVTGGVTAYTDTLVINGPTYVTTGGVTVRNGGLRVIGTAQFNGDAEIIGGLSVAKGLKLNGGLYIGAGGGTFNLGGLTVNGGLTVASAGLTVNRRGVTILSDGLVVSGGIQLKKVKSGLTVNSAVSVLSDGVSIAGGLSVLTGGVVTDSGLSINSGGLVVAELNMQGGGMTVSGGITVDSNGMSVSGGITVMDVGVTVDSTTSTNNVAGGVTVSANGLFLPDALTIFSGGVVVTDGVTVPVDDVNIDSPSAVQVKSFGVMIPLGGLTIHSDGFFITAGLTVVDGGLSITAGGLSIEGNGLRIYGGLDILSDGCRIAGGMTVSTKGVTLNDGVSIQSGGFNVYGGVTVEDTGVFLDTGGLTVLNAGLRVSGGTTINPGGLRVTGGLSVLWDGLRTVQGMTVNNGGFRVTGGLINTDTTSVVIAGGLSVDTPGLYSANAMTVFSAGLKVSTGVSIQDNGLEVLDGITLSDSGLVVSDDGLSVMSASLWVTGGMTVNDPTSGIHVVNSMTVSGGGQIVDGWSVQNNGLQVNNGGFTIAGDGLKVTTGGLTVQGGLRAHSLTIANTGINVAAGGLSVSSTGLVISDSGLTIHDDGLRASDGVFITGGLKLNDGMSVASGGLTVKSGGITLSDIGASVSGGVSILADGLTAAGDMVITTGNLIIDDKMDIGANGLRVANGLTLTDVGLTTGSTLTVTRTGINSAEALIAQDNGVRVLGGDVSVQSLGIKVTDGATVSFGGVSFDSSTVAPGTNVIDADGLYVLGAAPVQVLSDGVEVLGDLRVNGSVYFGQMYNAPSDARLKTQVHRLEGALSKLERVRGVSYNFKNPRWDLDSGRLSNSSLDSSPTDRADQDLPAERTGKLRFVGLIAQELQAVLPEVVSGIRLDGEDYLGVRYTDVVPLVIEAVRELDERSRETALKWASQQSVRSTTSAKQRNTMTTASVTARTADNEDELFRRYFTFDNSTNQVTGVKPYHGSCNCGAEALTEMLSMLQRIQVLEADEIRLTSQLDAVKSS